MKLSETLTEEKIINISATQWDNGLLEILKYFQKTNQIDDIEEVYSSILKREKIQHSFAGRGLAYPQGKHENLGSFVFVLAISKKGLNCESPDSLPCNIILMTISPTQVPDDHCRFINLFRIMVKDSTVWANIIEASDAKEIISIIRKWEIEQDKLDEEL